MERPKHILVVGAGISGLQVVKALTSAGFSVDCIEENNAVAGVWHRNYSGFGLQIPFSLYQFADFPCPPALQPTQAYAAGPEVAEYITAYAEHYELNRHIRLCTRLISLSRASSSQPDTPGADHNNPDGWVAIVEDTSTGQRFSITTDYVVICTGLFSTPFIPTYDGMVDFEGTLLHSRDATNLDVVRDRDVVVVGAGRTGWELVSKIGVASVARSVTILFRRAHWTLPRNMPGGRDIGTFLYSRHTASMLPPYYTAGAAQKAGHKLMKPVKRLFWKRLEQDLRKLMDEAKAPPPQSSLCEDLFHGGQVVDDTWHKAALSDPRVETKAGVIKRLTHDSAILEGGEKIKADVILFCTGYYNDYRFLSSDVRSKLGVQEDGLYLYRNMLPPRVPGLAFVGAEVATFNHMTTSFLQAQWLTRMLMGRVKIPDQLGMETDVLAMRKWRRARMPAARNRGAVYMLYAQCYYDQLVTDMGERTNRKANPLRPLAEWREAYSPADYAGLLDSKGDGRSSAGGATPQPCGSPLAMSRNSSTGGFNGNNFKVHHSPMYTSGKGTSITGMGSHTCGDDGHLSRGSSKSLASNLSPAFSTQDGNSHTSAGTKLYREQMSGGCEIQAKLNRLPKAVSFVGESAVAGDGGLHAAKARRMSSPYTVTETHRMMRAASAVSSGRPDSPKEGSPARPPVMPSGKSSRRLSSTSTMSVHDLQQLVPAVSQMGAMATFRALGE